MIQQIYDMGLAQVFYLAFGLIGLLFEALVAVLICGKLKIKWWKALLLIAASYNLRGYIANFFEWLESGQFSGGFLTTAYPYIPVLIIIPMALLLRVEKRRACDLSAASLLAFQAPVHLGCIFVGCCRGFQCDFGIWNPYRQFVTFPVQICDAITCAIIAIGVLIYMHKKNWDTKGTVFPIALILQGCDRFLWEFFRFHHKVFLGMTNLQLHALFLIAAGIISLILVNRYNKKHPDKEEYEQECKKEPASSQEQGN